MLYGRKYPKERSERNEIERLPHKVELGENGSYMRRKWTVILVTQGRGHSGPAPWSYGYEFVIGIGKSQFMLINGGG